MLHQKQQNFIMHVTDEYNQIVVTALVNITSWNVGPALLDNLRGGIPRGVALSSLTFHGLFCSMHNLRCKTTYIASCRTERCAMQILLAYPLGGPHGIQTKITIFLTKNLSLTLL